MHPLDRRTSIAAPEDAVDLDSALPPTEPFAVVIGGGGVAALEAILTLRHDAPELAVTLISPEPDFTLKQFTVGQPFGGEEPHRLDLASFCRRNDVTLRLDGVAEIWSEQRRVLLDSGEDLPYDALLLAMGALREEALPGAHTFRGGEDVAWFGAMLDQLERGHLHHIVFAVPFEVRWSLPLYELALMTARLIRHKGLAAEVVLATHEPFPLGDLGGAAGKRITELLDDVGIDLRCGLVPESVGDGFLRFADGEVIETSEVVALPKLRVPPIPGLPQGRNGFIATDATMRVEGPSRVWAAGDATWFPIKQGGIAAQQADVAATAIAEVAGTPVQVPAFNPVVRGVLLTGDEPQYFNAKVGTDGKSSAAPLWWPPAKVAGRWLAPYLAREWEGNSDDPLVPLQDRMDGDARSHREGLDLALRFADVDAEQGEFANALRWLAIAERLNLILPPEWAQKRAHWREIVNTHNH